MQSDHSSLQNSMASSSEDSREALSLFFNPFIPNGFFYLHSLDCSISNKRGVWLVLLLLCFIEVSVFNANSVYPDQTLHSATSDLGLYCLPMSLPWDARHKWVKFIIRRLKSIRRGKAQWRFLKDPFYV